MNRLEELESLLAKDPSNRLFYSLCEEYRKIGEIEKAIDVCEKGLKLHPNHIQARISLAQMKVGQNKLDDALHQLERVLLALPDNIPANHLAADIYFEKKLKEKAIKHYKIVTLFEPDNEEVLKRLRLLEEANNELKTQPETIPEIRENLIQKAVGETETAEESPTDVDIDINAPGTLTEILDHSPLEDDLFNTAKNLTLSEESFLSKEIEGDEGILSGGVKESDNAFETVKLFQDEVVKTQEPSRQSQIKKEESIPEGGVSITTETLAKLYEEQGYFDKAIEIYQHLLLSDSDNARIRRKIEDIKKRDVISEVGIFKSSVEFSKEEERRKKRLKQVHVLESWLQRMRQENYA